MLLLRLTSLALLGLPDLRLASVAQSCLRGVVLKRLWLRLRRLLLLMLLLSLLWLLRALLDAGARQ